MSTSTQASPAAGVGPLTLHGLSVEGVNQCVHCGLCLASCPTFSELGTEMDSPRGRIFLIKSLAEGRMSLSDSTVRHLSLCLDCRPYRSEEHTSELQSQSNLVCRLLLEKKKKKNKLVLDVVTS